MKITISMQDAADRIRRGELVAFPTETVYGLGANALDAGAVAKIYALKGRPPTSPLIVHASSVEMARTLVTEWPAAAEQLARAYWPGPLTLVLPKVKEIPDVVTAGLPTVGIRVPQHPIALELIQTSGCPLAAPSANRFMELSPTTAQHVCAAFGDSVPVLDGGPCQVGIESTVVSIANGIVMVLRPGQISRTDIESTLQREVSLIEESSINTMHDLEAAHSSPHLAPHLSPGMHARHYSPRTPLLLVNDPLEIPAGLGAYIWWDKPRSEKLTQLPGLRMPADPSAYAAQLYRVLHDLDAGRWAWIALELPPDRPEWAAVLDRLRRAASK